MAIIVSDMEGTLTTGATWRGVGEYLKQYRDPRAYRRFFVARLPGAFLARRGLIDEQNFKNRWIVDLLRLFTDATPDSFAHLCEWVVEHELWPHRRQDVLDEIARHRQTGARVIVASGVYQPLVEVFATRIGAEALGTPVEIKDGRVRVVGEVAVRHLKAEQVRGLLDGAGVDVAYGDTDSDVPLLELARQAVAVYPNKALRKVARTRCWRVIEVGPVTG